MNKMFENTTLNVFIQLNLGDEFIFLSYFKIDSKKILERNQVEVVEVNCLKVFRGFQETRNPNLTQKFH